MLNPSNPPVRITEIPPGLKMRLVPSAASGFPSPAGDWEDDALDLIQLLRLDSAAAYVFRLDGNSMIEAGLFDRDIVVIDRNVRPRNGSIVIALVEGGWVCRQFVVRRDTPLLEHRNARMTYPLCVCDELVEIFGVVRASVRDMSQ